MNVFKELKLVVQKTQNKLACNSPLKFVSMRSLVQSCRLVKNYKTERKTKVQILVKMPSMKSFEKYCFPLPFSKRLEKWFPLLRNIYFRVAMTLVALVFICSEVIAIFQPNMSDTAYALGTAGNLLSPVNQQMAEELKFNPLKGVFSFDTNPSEPVAGLVKSANNQVSATAHTDASQGITVTDPINKISFTVTPNFGLGLGRQDGNRIVYPLSNANGWVVYTMHSIGYKEDVLLSGASGNSLSFGYTLNLSSGLKARKQNDGSIGVYGNSIFSGNITTSTAKDAALLKKARLKAPKNTLLFTIPAPTVAQLNKKPSTAKVFYTLADNKLTVNITGLQKASYPLTIDPSVYVTSAEQFMEGNNETNINFDIADGLIEKGATTGARFDSWTPTKSLNTAVWQQGVAAAGGYIYTVGGNYPNGLSATYNTQGNATYTVPSGYTNITVTAWGGGGGGGGGGSATAGGSGGGAGYIKTTLTVTPGQVLNVYVGAGGSGGNTNGGGAGGAGGGGGGYSSVSNGSSPLVVAAGGAGGGGGDSTNTNSGGAGGAGGGSSGVSGSTSGGNGGGSGASQSAGGAGGAGHSSGANGGSLSGGAGGDGNSATIGGGGAGGAQGGGNGGAGNKSTGGGRNRGGSPGGGGGGGGYYGGGGGGGSTGGGGSSGGGGGGGGSSYSSGSNTTNTAGSGSNPGDASDPSNNGAGTGGGAGAANNTGSNGTNGLVIISAGSGSTNTSDVTWSQFDPSSGALDSANPGSGTCGGWCTTSAYSLPAPRSALSLVAYNGFLYAIGGEDSSCTATNGTGDSGICSTVYIAKIGANGEPQLWSPVSTDKSTWTYWYQDANLTSPRSMITAVAYNNKMYLLGGKTSSSGTVSIANTAQVADITATGKLGAWSSDTNLPYADYGYGAQVYNGYIYLIGGASSVGGAPLSSVYYNKINSDGSLNSWLQTSSLAGGRFTEGGNFTTVWGGYIYLAGGCSNVDGGGYDYCTTTATDTQLASINADGSLDTWTEDPAVADGRVGENVTSWRGYIYEIAGCTAQNTTNGSCTTALATIKYGTINQEGDVTLLNSSVASGTSPCSGTTPYNCNLPGAGGGNNQIGQMLNATAIINGYIYLAGGCTATNCSQTSKNTTYAAINSNGTLTAPANCATDHNTLVGAWCVDSQHSITVGGPGGSNGIAAAATAVFGNNLYLIGGIDGASNTNEIYYNTTNSDGSLTGNWTAESLSGTGAVSVSYEYAFMRSNPGSASTAPANLFILGGCSATTNAACTSYTDAVYKCQVYSDSSIQNCSTSGQLQIGTVSGATGAGLAGIGGTVYANYVYLIGGTAPGQTSGLPTVRYAEINNSNNIVAVSGGAWVEAANQMASARQLSVGFGYNGYIYVIGGYNSNNGVLNDIEFAKINVSDGSIGTFNTSVETINSRWGFGAPVSGSYVYSVGGCQAGSAPSGCTNMQPTVDTVEIYNNDSGAPAGYSTSAHTYSANPNLLGASSTVLNGYIYVAGGCTSTTDCTAATNNVSYAPIDAQGNVGTWSSTTGSLPAGRVWGKLVTAGDSLYYVGGQDSTGAAQSTVYYATPSSGNISSWSTASNGLPQSRANFGATVWNNRIYVIGGVNGVAGSASYSSSGTYTFTVPTGVTTISIKAWGGGGGGAGGGGHGAGGAGGGGGYVTSSFTVTGGEQLTVTVGGGGAGGGHNGPGGIGGGGGGYSDVSQSGTNLIIAAGGAGGGGGAGQNTSSANGGAGGAGGGTSGTAGSANGSAHGGSGGTQSAGGAGGAGDNNGASGGSLSGGAGADGVSRQSTTGGGNNGGSNGGGAGGNGNVSNNYGGGGGGGGGYYGGGGGSGSVNQGGGYYGGITGAAGGGGGSSYSSGSGVTNTAGSGQNPGNSGDPDVGSAGNGGRGGNSNQNGSAGTDGKVVISYGSTNSLYISPQLNSGGDITSAWSSSANSINAPRSGLTAVAYANNLYIFGGDNGTTYYSDSQYAQINPVDGSVGSWSYSTTMPQPLAQGDGFAANGYVYLIGGRSNATTCSPVTLVAPISANTTIASGNHPTGVGQWFLGNQKYTGNRYGDAVAYYNGKAYVLGGACGSTLTYASPVIQQTSLLSQPQVAEYSIMIDADSDVYPNYWLLNGLDNSIGAEWQLKYQSMTNTTTYCSSPAMTTWGATTNFGNVTLGTPGVYSPLDGSGKNTNCARFFNFDITINDSQAYGYPDDVSRGPTITDLALQFTADPSKRLMHGRTFIGGLQQPDDTPYYTH